jgi:hypothetical protein
MDRAIVLLESNLGFSELEQMVQESGREQVCNLGGVKMSGMGAGGVKMSGMGAE